ncbi:MAG: glycosyltransferase family 39 protein, partial [Gaiellaceae bacterium]
GDLLAGDGFGSVSEDRASVPTQPLLIAGVERVFGQNYLALRLAFALLGALTCVVAYFLARELFGAGPFGSSVAIIAGALLAIYPYYIYLSALFEYPQTLFILMMGLVFLLVYRHLRTGALATLALAGGSLGVAVLAVPTTLAFVPVLAGCLLLLGMPRKSLRPALLGVLVLIGATVLPIAAWTARNYAAYGELILVNQAGGVNFWVANNETYFKYGKDAVIPACGPRNEGRPHCKQVIRLEHELRAEHLSDAQYIIAEEAASWRAGWRFVLESPLRTVRLSLRKLVELWSPRPDATTVVGSAIERAKIWVSVLSYFPTLLLALCGVILLRREARRLLPIYAYVLTFTAVYSVFLPTTRYRLPLDFFLAILAAYTLR